MLSISYSLQVNIKSYLAFSVFWIYHFELLSFSNPLPNVSAQLLFSLLEIMVKIEAYDSNTHSFQFNCLRSLNNCFEVNIELQ